MMRWIFQLKWNIYSDIHTVVAFMQINLRYSFALFHCKINEIVMILIKSIFMRFSRCVGGLSACLPSLLREATRQLKLYYNIFVSILIAQNGTEKE